MSDFLHDKECEWQGEEPSACGCFVRVSKKERDFWKQQTGALEKAFANSCAIRHQDCEALGALDIHRKAKEEFGSAKD